LRYDKLQEGRLDFNHTKGVFEELGVALNDKDLHSLIVWFDTNGSKCLDYNQLTSQLYGDDVMTKSFRLPSLPDPKLRLISTAPPTAGGASSISTMSIGKKLLYSSLMSYTQIRIWMWGLNI
jgi:hypothetical protein